MKKIFISSALAISILLSSCAGGNVSVSHDSDEGETTRGDTTAVEETQKVIDDDRQTENVLTGEYSYEVWHENAYAWLKTQIINTDNMKDLVSDRSNYLGWGTAYTLDALYRGYCATGDIAFLEKFSLYIYQIYEVMSDKNGDGYLSWGTAYEYGEKGPRAYEYEEYACESGMILNMAGVFCCIVKGDPSLAERETPVGISYGELADHIIDRSVNHAIPAFDQDWNDELGVYMDRPGSLVYDGADGQFSLPHNQYLLMALALMNFAKFTPEHRDEYMYRAERMCENFSAHIKRYPNLGVVVWNYNDPLYDTDHPMIRQEDFSHGMLDIRAIVNAYENGVVLSLEDVHMLAKTYDTLMFRATEPYPALSDYIDGTGDAVGYIRYESYDLSVFSDKITERGMDYMLQSGTDKGIDATQVLAFHPDTPAPKAFSLTTPAEGDNEVDTDNAVFLWQRTAYANYYRIEIAEDSEFNNIIAERDKIINSGIIVDDLPADKELYVRVTAMNIKGDSTLSNTVKFKIAK